LNSAGVADLFNLFQQPLSSSFKPRGLKTTLYSKAYIIRIAGVYARKNRNQ